MSNLEPGTDPTRVMSQTQMGAANRTLVAPQGGASALGPSYEDLRTQIGGTVVCPLCKATTPAVETYCGDCGFLLSSQPADAVTLPEDETPLAELVDAAEGRRFPLRAGINTVGRQATDILVAETTVSRQHARIIVENGAVTVEDLGSSNGTKVGERRIGPNQPTPAAHGMPLKFGNWRVTLDIAGAGASAAAAEPTVAMPLADTTQMETGLASPSAPASAEPLPPSGPVVAMLTLFEGPGQDIAIQQGTITIGRRSTNNLSLPNDSFVSGRHAEITTDMSGTYLTDLGSTNGTVVNGQKLAPNVRQLLLDGDEVQLGQGKYRFALADLEDTDTEAGAMPPDKEQQVG